MRHIKGRLYRCEKCRCHYVGDHPAAFKCRCFSRWHYPTHAKDLPCDRRGELLRTVERSRCGKIFTEEVHACTEFGEASIRPLNDVKGTCLQCPILFPVTNEDRQ